MGKILNRCSGIQFLLSGYTAGSLSEEDSRRVEGHIGICERCYEMTEEYKVVRCLEGKEVLPDEFKRYSFRNMSGAEQEEIIHHEEDGEHPRSAEELEGFE